MNEKETLPASWFEFFLLMSLAAIPLCLFAWMAVSHSKNAPLFDPKERDAAAIQKAEPLGQNMSSWDNLSWDDKESAAAMAIEFFRKTANIAILKSPQHYVLLINTLLKEKPEAKEQSIFVILQSLAIQEYDFFNGQNADAQAKQLLGPELFERNKNFQKAREEEFTRR